MINGLYNIIKVIFYMEDNKTFIEFMQEDFALSSCVEYSKFQLERLGHTVETIIYKKM